jgi:hypothetical protein
MQLVVASRRQSRVVTTIYQALSIAVVWAMLCYFVHVNCMGGPPRRCLQLSCWQAVNGLICLNLVDTTVTPNSPLPFFVVRIFSRVRFSRRLLTLALRQADNISSHSSSSPSRHPPLFFLVFPSFPRSASRVSCD